MKKPVAEVNIKIFSGDGHYKADTIVKINSNNPNTVIATLEALEDTKKKIAKKECKKVAKKLIKELEDIFEEDECTR